ncbi:hypothetical protein [Rhizobium leguminosarum]|uniref:hypothetical protein n=1 Tax=Rhizobium leguminosarum TaxID=384 RepID=UPI000AC05FEB|nr:hypothetical protein [Rhizobium leguminosarum]
MNGGAGADTISASHKNAVNAGSGNDVLTMGHDNLIDAGAGDDTIYAGVGNTITGGTGNDRIVITDIQSALHGSTGSTVKFAVGDGRDSVTLVRSSSTLELGEGFTAANTKVTFSDNKATISFDGNETDGISVDFLFDSALTLSFADGSTLEVKPGIVPAPTLVSSYGQA